MISVEGFLGFVDTMMATMEVNPSFHNEVEVHYALIGSEFRTVKGKSISINTCVWDVLYLRNNRYLTCQALGGMLVRGMMRTLPLWRKMRQTASSRKW